MIVSIKYIYNNIIQQKKSDKHFPIEDININATKNNEVNIFCKYLYSDIIFFFIHIFK